VLQGARGWRDLCTGFIALAAIAAGKETGMIQGKRTTSQRDTAQIDTDGYLK
jgi:hypothetical protein